MGHTLFQYFPEPDEEGAPRLVLAPDEDHTVTRKKVGQPTLPASPAAPQPVGQTLRWVIGTREATGELRLQGDCEPVSRNLFKWTGQAGPPGAGVTEAAAPSLARPRTAGEPSPTA